MTHLCTLLLLVAIIIPLFSFEETDSMIKPKENLKKFPDKPEDSPQNFTGLASKYGYLSQKYEVTTEDGYILYLFRLNSKRCDHLLSPPVFLMHGLLFSSDSWLDSGPNASLAFMLADSCYDLWVGNVRGNYYGRRHLNLNPDQDKEFWNYCVDDNGYYDIPAQIDKILEVTDMKQLNYIGFSQGCAEVVIACTERPVYCDKVKLFIALAPALRMKNTRSALFRAASQAIAALDSLLSRLGIYEILFNGGILQELLQYRKAAPLYDEVLAAIDSNHVGSIELITFRKLFTHFPAGSSKKTFLKYAQSFNDEDFRKFDYGSETNIQRYGAKEAPRFEIEKVKFPTAIVYGLNDYIVDPKDMYWLQNRLPNVLELKVVDSPLWNHFDVPFSRYSPRLLFPFVNDYLKQYSNSSYF